MVNTTLPLRTVDQLHLHLNITHEDLETLLVTMPRQFCRYSKHSVSGKVRKIYNPNPSLRNVQRPLQKLLSQIPISDAAHGWRAGRSPATNATPHVGRAAVMKMDIEDFFPSCHYLRVQRLFLDLGCSDEVSCILRRLTTADYHLPQGFITSPTIANLLLAVTDRRLEGLSRQRRASYTRYGDDLAFSGPKSIVKMAPMARRILGEAGHVVNNSKFAEGGVRYASDRQEICAITVNEKLNLRKPNHQNYSDLIRRCVLLGPSCEQREGETLEHMQHRLGGYINYVRGINRQAAQRLQVEYDKISWAWTTTGE